MRSLWKTTVLIALSTLAAGALWAQAVVTLSGSVISLDSGRANVTIRGAAGKDQLVIITPQTDIRLVSATGSRLTADQLTPGSKITVDADKDATGRLMARRIIIQTREGTIPPAGPPPANQGTVTAVPRETGGVARVNVPARPVGTARVAATTRRSGSIAARPGQTGNYVWGTGAAMATAVENGAVGEVRMNGHSVFRFRGSQGGNPFLRAQEVARRLDSTAMYNLHPNEVYARRLRNGEWAVVARGQTLITADSALARINATTPRRLAAQWVANVRAQLVGA